MDDQEVREDVFGGDRVNDEMRENRAVAPITLPWAKCEKCGIEIAPRFKLCFNCFDSARIRGFDKDAEFMQDKMALSTNIN